MADRFSLALSFDTDSLEFARGVEIGRLWEQLQAAPDEPVEQDIHVVNAEMALRLGEALGRDVSSAEHDSAWMTVTFRPVADHLTKKEDHHGN